MIGKKNRNYTTLSVVFKISILFKNDLRRCVLMPRAKQAYETLFKWINIFQNTSMVLFYFLFDYYWTEILIDDFEGGGGLSGFSYDKVCAIF